MALVEAEAGSWLDTQLWACEEFGRAPLGDRRRTKRLVALASAAAQRPAGTITEVCLTDAERQGAYGWLSSDEFAFPDVLEGAQGACVERLASERLCFVPVDQTSLGLTDAELAKDFGAVGTYTKGRRGLQAMTAVGVSLDGVPAGICGQKLWPRPPRPYRKPRRHGAVGRQGKRSKAERRKQRVLDRTRERNRRNAHRPWTDKESYAWFEVCAQAAKAFAGRAGGAIPWFQCDRGADNQNVLYAFVEQCWLFTVRSSYDRVLADGGRLRERLAESEPLGSYEMEVPARKKSPARWARMTLRACEVTLKLRNKQTGHMREVSLWAVQAIELRPPAGQKALDWVLLTSFPAVDFQSARLVVRGYEARWRVEQMHRTWKRGGCRVETTQLRTAERVRRWALILACVAQRTARLTYLARSEPDKPSLEELSQEEVDAAILLKRPPGWRPGEKPPLGKVVQWIAELGGYTGKSSGGPPGQTVIGRGLERIETVAIALRNQRELSSLAQEK